MNNKAPTMLAETLRERDEMKIDEGRREGLRAGRQEGMRAGRREVLCSLASRRFGTAAGAELAIFLAGIEDGTELSRIGTLIIDCDSGPDFLARARHHSRAACLAALVSVQT